MVSVASHSGGIRNLEIICLWTWEKLHKMVVLTVYSDICHSHSRTLYSINCRTLILQNVIRVPWSAHIGKSEWWALWQHLTWSTNFCPWYGRFGFTRGIAGQRDVVSFHNNGRCGIHIHWGCILRENKGNLLLINCNSRKAGSWRTEKNSIMKNTLHYKKAPPLIKGENDCIPLEPDFLSTWIQGIVYKWTRYTLTHILRQYFTKIWPMAVSREWIKWGP